MQIIFFVLKSTAAGVNGKKRLATVTLKQKRRQESNTKKCLVGNHAKANPNW